MKRSAPLCATFSALLLCGCMTPAPYVPPAAPSLATWRGALEDLANLRVKATGGGGPRTLKLALALREPFTGRRTEARGAVALAPDRGAVRMILVGPGGTTAFDLWISGDRFRMSIPAIDLLKRGDASTPREQMRGMPVSFLRWWLLDPTRGQLLWSDKGSGGARYVLREGGAITELAMKNDHSVLAWRRTWAEADRQRDPDATRVLLDEETVEADRLGCGHARYTQASTGVEVEINCEGVEPNPPSERAFVDPDAPEEEEQ